MAVPPPPPPDIPSILPRPSLGLLLLSQSGVAGGQASPPGPEERGHAHSTPGWGAVRCSWPHRTLMPPCCVHPAGGWGKQPISETRSW